MQAYEQKTERFLVGEEKRFIGSAIGVGSTSAFDTTPTR